jgi:demethylmenaquinone methyltransferase/2-methoxy-6-polyprenyl-1,4-benzoquinol methylase
MTFAFPVNRRAPDRSAALVQYRRRARIYDRELALFEPIRVEAIASLGLHQGQSVLDVGCGTGLSFEMLHGRVGRHGRIVGIEQCPEMLSIARKRVAVHHWDNVELVQQPAATAPLPLQADAALFHFTHDILRDGDALAHVMQHLKPGARVVATGLQWAPPWMWTTNGFVLLAALHSVTALEGLGKPWDKLAGYLDDLRVDTALLGGIFIATGKVKAAPDA